MSAKMEQFIVATNDDAKIALIMETADAMLDAVERWDAVASQLHPSSPLLTGIIAVVADIRASVKSVLVKHGASDA